MRTARIHTGEVIIDDDGDKGGGGLRTERPYELSGFRSKFDAEVLTGTGYLIESKDESGAWVTRAHRHPRGEISQYVADVGSENLIRFVFLARHLVRNIGTGTVAARPEQVKRAEIVRANHSRFGDMRARLRWSDGVSAGVEPGDTLDFEVRVPDDLGMDEPALILAGRGYYSDMRGSANELLVQLGSFANALSPARPNPMSGRTTLAFELRDAAITALEIYSATGRHVVSLVNGPLEAGPHEVAWNGRDHAGRPVTAGVYFYRLSVPGWTRQGKLTMLR